jgi:hypothetical protein
MTNGLKEVITRLERQRTAIERALSALREIDGQAPTNSRVVAAGAPAGPRKAKRKGGMTPDGRRRLSEALKKRWAAKRAASALPPATAKATKRKGRKKAVAKAA